MKDSNYLTNSLKALQQVKENLKTHLKAESNQSKKPRKKRQTKGYSKAVLELAAKLFAWNSIVSATQSDLNYDNVISEEEYAIFAEKLFDAANSIFRNKELIKSCSGFGDCLETAKEILNNKTKAKH